MVIGFGIMTFRLHDCRSLKAKRKVVKSIIGRLCIHFNASVAEVGSNDLYQEAQIGFTMAGNSKRTINSKMDKLINMAEDFGLAELIDNNMEIMVL